MIILWPPALKFFDQNSSGTAGKYVSVFTLRPSWFVFFMDQTTNQLGLAHPIETNWLQLKEYKRDVTKSQVNRTALPLKTLPLEFNLNKLKRQNYAHNEILVSVMASEGYSSFPFLIFRKTIGICFNNKNESSYILAPLLSSSRHQDIKNHYNVCLILYLSSHFIHFRIAVLALIALAALAQNTC